jgi:PAS domain S-box-containing protein
VTLANTAFRALVPRAVPSRDAATLPLWRAWDAAGVPLGKEQFPTTRALRGENVLPGQEMLYGPEGGTQIWMQVSAVPMRDEGGEVVGTVSALVDIDALKRSEAALRQSEERQAFLLKVSDTLRPLADARDIADNACRLLVELLSAGQAQYADIKGEPGGEMGAVCGEYVGSGEPFPRRFSLAPFGEPVLQTLRAARSLVISDVETDTRLDAAQRESFHAVKAPAVISVPLVKEGRWIAALTLQDIHARDWTATDIDLVESVAERTWSAIERARAERAIEERDARYRDLFERMDEGFAEMEAVRDHEGIVTDFRHLARNPASERVTGLPTEQVLGRLVGEVLPPEDARYWIDAYAKVLASGQPERFEHYIPALGRWFGVNVTLYGDDGVGVFYENITTRKRAEQTLRESEERFQQFADASSAGLWIRDASTLTMEYVSRAVPNIYGVPPENFLGPIEQWASHIVPEDRDAALEHIEQARQGNSVVHEFRIQRPSDLAFRWIRNTDFPLRDPAGNVQRIGGLAEDVTETKRLQEHQGVLLAELQHRVRNIMAMIRSMANRGGDGSRTVEDYRQVLTGRLLALARVQTLLTRQSDTGGPLRGVIESEISAQADHDGQYELIGSDVTLSPKAMEVLTLAFHELATNALKYGALSVPGGRVSVTWSAVEKNGLPWLVLDWIEEGAPLRAPPTRRGFGTELIEGKIPYELGGVGKISFEAGGARCHFELPLREGKSILETDSPVATLVFGGALDMSGAPDLTGQRVLIIEDDYYLASDTSAALRGAGAQVIGPCPREDLALRLLEEQAPTAAVVDINLGGGPRFAVAEHLRSRHVPFVFLTGYDAGVIPEVFANIRRLQKPIALRDVVEAVSELKAKAAA